MNATQAKPLDPVLAQNLPPTLEALWVPKRSGTYPDVLEAYGLAVLVDRIFRQRLGAVGGWRIRLEDAGGYYRIDLDRPLETTWLAELPYFRSPAPYIVRARDKNPPPPDVDIRDVDATWEQVRAYHDQRQALREQGVQGTDLEQQLRDLEPPWDWQTVAFLGDTRMQATDIYNRLVAGWSYIRPIFVPTLAAILALYARPDSPAEEILDAWHRLARPYKLRVQETASQLLNPHQGKGQNRPKANGLRMDNIKDRPWPVEYLKAVGLWHTLAPRQVQDNDRDWKVYVLAPLRMPLASHRTVFRRFSQVLWQERGATHIKSDITSLLLFVQVWLDYIETTPEKTLLALLGESRPPAERVVAGFHTAQFKKLSQQAYTMINLSFLRLPAWSGELRTSQDVQALKQVLREHLDVVRNIDEGRSDGFELLRTYREFVAGSNWEAFFEFLAAYGHDVIRRLNEGAKWVPLFTTDSHRRLIMASRAHLLPIVQNPGFQNLAYAIRHSTIIPQTRKARGQDALYEIRYGLGAELKRKSTVRDEFVAALMDFVHSYNQENAQKLENTGQQMRRDIRTSDIEEVVRLVDEYGPELVASLLVAYGYAREPREEAESPATA